MEGRKLRAGLSILAIKEFLSDIKALHERARKHIENLSPACPCRSGRNVLAPQGALDLSCFRV